MKIKELRPTYRVVDDSVIIENYNQAPPFSSFFPALAGETGKPMWVFYTNRGQAIASFGVNNKDGAMMEFQPANKAYQATSLLGFRTFIRPLTKSQAWVEPFLTFHPDVHQELIVRPYDLTLREVNKALQMEIFVHYFGVPSENCPVLARSLTIKNLSSRPMRFNLIDGLPRVVPWGMGDFLVKNMSRTIEAFAEVTNKRETIPFFKLKVEPHDRPDVRRLEGGFFSFTVNGESFLPVIVDPRIVFNQDSSFLRPSPLFGANGLSGQHQLTSNIMPSSLSYGSIYLKPKAEQRWCSYFGHADSPEIANAYAEKIKESSDYFDRKKEEIKGVYQNLVRRFGFHSDHPTLNAYALNTFMDNVLRGGFPLSLSPKGPILHVYSRKHGDMERDYNAFQISATYFSQGNGNFRDVNQNRRHDILLNPQTGSLNVEFFFNLIQLDGYNPLVINPVTFVPPKDLSHLNGFNASDEFRLACQRLRREPVLPGTIYDFVRKYATDPLNVGNLFQSIIQKCEPRQGIQHGDGYWVDHWTYNLDHLDRYFDVYPEKKAEILFQREEFTFHDSAYVVRPRREKYVLNREGVYRQYGAVKHDKEKEALILSRKSDRDKVHDKNGTGEVYKTTLFVKLVALAVVKASTLDPFGMGIEMEADKPGWCDALNGCPGLFGSSTHELFELVRLLRFLVNVAIPLSPTKTIAIPQELNAFQKEVFHALAHGSHKDFRPAWDKLAAARERFREKTFFGLTGKTRPVRVSDLGLLFKKVLAVAEEAEKKCVDPDTKLPTSYYTYEIDGARLSGDWKTHMAKIPWKQHRVAPFLEGLVHSMKIWPPAKVKRLYGSVKKSALWDKKLGMYRLNVPLDKETPEIGRIRIFSGGWLENESIFLHMHYKYLLEILRSGLVEEFFKESRSGLIPFRRMETYGRPIFENSSFLASSTFPQKEVHGRGFVARLSGATSEFLSMVYHLFLGKNFFRLTESGVVFCPDPALPAEWFARRDALNHPKNSVSLAVFGVPVDFVNDRRKNTFGSGAVRPKSYEWILDGRFYTHEGSFLPPDATAAFREGRLEKLTVFLDR